MKHENSIQQAHTFTRRQLIAGAMVLSASDNARGGEPALPVVGLNHVSIRVPDVQRAGEFYAKLFGTDVSRATNIIASPASPRGNVWLIRLEQGSITVTQAAPGDKPGIDHFCLAVQGFNGDTMKPSLAGFNPQIDPEPPPGKPLWTKDPDGHLIQFEFPQKSSGVSRAGVRVEAPGGVKREPAFRATRITQLMLAVSRFEPCASYYRKLLGDEAEGLRKGSFRVGQSELVLGPVAGGEYFRVGMAGFDPPAVAGKLKSLGMAPNVVRERNAVAFSDLDGIKVQIGA